MPLSKKIIVNRTLRMIETDFNWYHQKFKEYTVFVERSEWFGWSLIFYWVFIMSVVYIFNIIKVFLGLKFLSRFNNLINKTLLIPSEFKNYHDKTFIFSGKLHLSIFQLEQMPFLWHYFLLLLLFLFVLNIMSLYHIPSLNLDYRQMLHWLVGKLH